MKETGRVRRGAADGPSAEEVRAWARENGHEVNDRGRVPKEIRDALDASH
ncbi:Lsr2 family DNA-binding protein [Streptomyces violaceusniger]